MTREIKETLEGLKTLIRLYEKRGGGHTQKIWLSYAIQILQAHEQAEGELEKKVIETKIVNILATLVFRFSDWTVAKQEERLIVTMKSLVELGKNVARPILAKALLKIKELERARKVEQGAWEETKKYQDENIKLKKELQSAKNKLTAENVKEIVKEELK